MKTEKRSYQLQKYYENREKRLEYGRYYNLNNKEKISNYFKSYYEKNRNKIIERMKEYRFYNKYNYKNKDEGKDIDIKPEYVMRFD